MISLAASAVCVGIGELPEDSKPPNGLRFVSYHMLRLIKRRIQRLRAPKAHGTNDGTKAELRTATAGVPQSSTVDRKLEVVVSKGEPLSPNIKADKSDCML